MDKVLPTIKPEVTPSGNKVLPTVERAAPRNRELDDIFLVQAAAIDSYINGTELGDNFNKYKQSFDPRSDAQRLAQAKATVDSSEIVRSVEENPYVGGLDVGTNLQATAIAKRQAAVDGNNPDLQFVESISTGAKGALNQEENTAEMMLQRQLLEIQEDVSGWDIAGSIGVAMIPLVDNIDNYSLTGSLLDGDDMVRSAIINYKHLAKTEQVRLLPILHEEFKQKLGKARASELISKFVEAGGEEETGDFHPAWLIPDLVDFTGVAYAGAKFLKSRSMIKTFKKAGDSRTAAAANVESIVDEDVAKTLGTTPESAVSTALPFKMENVDINSTDALSAESIGIIKEFVGQADELTEGLITDSAAKRSFVKEGLIDTQDRRAAEKAVMEKLGNTKHEDLAVLEKGEDYTVFSYNARDVDGNMMPETFTLQLDLDAAGDWKEADFRRGFPYATSPDVWLEGAVKRASEQAQRLDYVTPQVEKQLGDLMTEAVSSLGSPLKPGSKKKRNAVSKALIAGDEYLDDLTGARGKVFSPEELKDIYHLDEQSRVAYYKMNKIFDSLWEVANHSKRREMTLLKYRGIATANGERTYGKIQNTAGEALEALRKGEIRYIYDDVEGVVVKNGGREGWLDAHYDADKVLVRLDAPYQTNDEAVGQVKFMFVNRGSVGDLPEQILHKNVGYVTRFNDEASYFVKENIPSRVDGQVSSYPKTLRFFNNKVDADKYIDRLEAAALANSEKITTGSSPRYSNLPDREAESFSALVGDFSQGSGGLYTGTRSEDAIAFGLNGTEGMRINAFEALEKNISAIARVTTMNEWRLGLEQKWINSVNAHLKNIGKADRVESFGNVPKTMTKSEAGAFFLQMEEQIREWQGFASVAENSWKGTVQRGMDWAAAKGANAKVVEGIGSFKSADPNAWAKSAAFHSLLGSFNPAHLWVQAQGATLAVSLAAGKYLGKVTRDVAAFTSLGEAVVKSDVLMKRAAKISGMELDEFTAVHKLWKKGGMGDSVTQTADHAAALKGFGVTRHTLKKVADQGLIFYRNGELISRRTAFLTAVRRYKDKNKIDKLLNASDDALKSILTDTNNMLFNMSKANKAGFQKGVMSVPTQFLQVTTKSLETLLGANGHFTKAERGRLLVGQLAFYGTAGIPLAALPTMYMLETLGVTQADINDNPAAAKAINDGFWGLTSHWMLGEDIELSSRGSLFRGATDLIDRIMSDDSTMVEQALGAFGSTGQRFMTEFSEEITDMSLPANKNLPIDLLTILPSSVIATMSSWRNVEKAVIMNRLDVIRDKGHNVVVSDDFSFSNEVAALIGFQQSSEVRPWTLKERTDALAEVNNHLYKESIRLLNEYALKAATSGVTEKDRADHRQNMAFVAQLAKTPQDLAEINDKIVAHLRKDSKDVQAINTFLKNSANKMTDGVDNLKSLTLGTSLMILPSSEEE